jgi:hypothetical protein
VRWVVRRLLVFLLGGKSECVITCKEIQMKK